LLLTYGLRNADCHAKNLALLYTSRADVRLSPAYDMITTVAYAGYQQNPPGISFMGKKTWSPGKSLGKFIAATFGVSVKAQVEIVESISDAVSEIAPRVREAMTRYAAFEDIGKRMLLAWNEGITGLRGKRATVFRSRLARSLAACSTSSAMSSVVLMHQMMAHHASLIYSPGSRIPS
jgi:serine/threonine-protein kinase HipA